MALFFCYEAIQAARGNAGPQSAATWYTEQAAILHGSSHKGEEWPPY